ncbi:MAG: hypothetical protein E7665_06170 [Ruminococcaceae bacterium]|nr:hypothetical protein [Oscillospiraceae bacterium]
MENKTPYKYFKPERAASWWCTITDLMWPQQDVIDSIIKRADAMADAKIEVCVNFGFHMRFDFANHFQSLHGYLRNVAEELHKRGIKFVDHYSCNLIERPRGDDEYYKLHKYHRHHVLLHHDEKAAEYAQYEGIRYRDICEVDARDGTRGYSYAYMTELFCHNNPDFLKMHKLYLERLISEVPVDGMMVDDMCHYAGFRACTCEHCKRKFKEQFGHELPPFEDKEFWGDTTKGDYYWGNYKNPVFRDWVKFRTQSVVNHVKMVKETIGDIPLFTCCSSSGPALLNALSLNIERMSPYIDLALLENCGITVRSANWMGNDAEAMLQLDVGRNLGNAPAIALSYTIYDDGAYLAWALGRYWGVCNWMSTLHGRLAKQPKEAKDVPALIGRFNNWGIEHSKVRMYECKNIDEIRIVNNIFNRENHWNDEAGKEAWDYNKSWISALIANNVSYRFVRFEELADSGRLLSETSPLVLDNCGCISDEQFKAVCEYLENGGKAFVTLPFGVCDENGYEREKPLSDKLLSKNYPGLYILDNHGNAGFNEVLAKGYFTPRIKYISGDKRFYSRLKVQNDSSLVLHFLNGAMEGVAHQDDWLHGNKNILKELVSNITDPKIEFEIDINGLGITNMDKLSLKSPELYAESRPVIVTNLGNGKYNVKIDLTDIKVYAVIE